MFHGAVIAHHGSGVCDDQSVEAKVLPKQTGHKLPGKCCGDRSFREVRVEPFSPCGMIDVTDHKAHGTVFDHTPVYSAVGFFPFVHGHSVHADQQMLINFVNAVTGKMLYGYGYAAFVGAALVGPAHLQYHLGIPAIGAYINDGIAPVQVKVTHGCKGEIAAGSSCFPAGDQAHPIRVFGIACSTNAHLLAEESSIFQKAGGSEFQIRSAQNGDLAVVLHEL